MKICSCLELTELTTTCGACVHGVCPGCNYPNEIQCHLHGPTVGEHLAKFPNVHRSDWCADFKPRITRDELIRRLEVQGNELSDVYLKLMKIQEKLAEE